MTNYVASGTTLSGITLSTGDTVTATSSGTTPGIVSASVFNGGTALISRGGLITTTTMSGISAGQTGSVTVSSGGSATLDGVDGWTVNVLSAGSAISLSAAYDPASLLSGIINVSSGGVANSTVLSSGGVQNVSLGGNVTSTTIGSGGIENVLSGGHASKSIILSGANEIVSSGGSAVSAVVSSGGTETVISGGAVTSAIVSSGGNFVASNGTVAAFGALTLLGVGTTSRVFTWTGAGTSATTAIGETVSSNGNLYVSSGGFASSAKVLGNEYIYSGGSAVSTTVSSGGTETVNLGAKASATSVLSGGTETVSSGGTEVSGVVSSGGNVVVFMSGGTLSNETLNAGADLTVSGGTISGAGASMTLGAITAPTIVNWSSGGGSSAVVGTGETVASGGVITVLSGGSAASVSVSSGGSVNVSSGGVAGGYDPVIWSGGSVTVSAGGLYSATTVGFVEAGGSLTIQSGGVESGVTVYSGGIFDLQSGGSAVSGSFSGSPLTVVAGATAIANTFTTDTETVFGLDSGGILGAGAVQTVSSGGLASGVHVTGSGQQIIASSGVASGTLVSSGGLEAISSGGLAASTTVSSGGSAVVSAGGSAVSMTVSSGGTEIVMNGGIASSTLVLGSGTEIVSSGGIESGAVVSSGGLEVVYAGATLSNVTLSAGANLAEGGAVISSGTLTLQGLTTTLTGVNVSSGSALPAVVTLFSGSVVSGATVVASSGGVISGDTISSGGSAVVSSGGIARSASIGVGGSEVILAGGSGSATTILSGGVETVSSGGVESGVVVSSGGIEYVLSGGTESGGTVSSGGTVEWVSGAVVSSLQTVPGGTFLVSAPIVSSGKTLTLAGGNGFFSWPASGGSAATADIGATILSGGKEIVSSGGTDTSGTVNSGGTISLGTSGALSNVTFASGANLVASGGTVSGAGVSLTVAPYASSTVVNWPASGGVAQVTSAIAETVNSGGTIIVSSGGVVSGINEGSGGSLVVTSGGIASGGLAQGGSISIGSGGSGVANQIENGGSLLVSGGTESGALIAYANLGPTIATVESGGITSKSTIQQGGVEMISAGGSSISATTDQLGSQFVLSGGSAVSATIAGLQVVSAGGFASATTLRSAFAGYPAILQDAGTVQGVTISGTGASAVVLSGGVENLAVVSSGGTEIISSGGTASGTVVNSGGTEALYVGAAFTNATFNLGANVALEGVISGAPPVVVSGLTSTLTGQNLASGATPSTITEVLSATVVSGGEVDVQSGGLISATTISTGGSAFVSSGGRTSGVTLVAGGSETILSSGSATSTTVGSGGILQVSAGGSAISGIVGTSGAAYVSGGGSALMMTVSSGGNLFVSSGGYASGTTVTAGGSETVVGTETYPGAGGAFGVQSGGVQTILAGGVVSADTVGAGGVQIVSSGGTVINPTSGTPIRGTQIFWVGANVTDWVSAGARLEEAGLTVSGGVNVALKPFASLTSVSVGAGGTTSNLTDLISATVLSGGSVTISSGATTTATYLNGGTETVLSGGTAGLGSAANGGYEDVLSGGHLVSGFAIGSGGTLELANGAVTSAPISFTAGAGIVAFDGTSTATPITGFQAGDEIALSSFSAGITSASLLNGGTELSITDGGQTFVVSSISFVPGVLSGGQLDDAYQFTAGTVLVNGQSEQEVTLTYTPETEGPVLTGTIGTANEGGVVTLGLTDTVFDGDDTLGTVTITGLAGDLSNFSAGSYVAGTGSWTGTAADFNALTFTAGEDGTSTLTISATNTTASEAATTTANYTLTVSPGTEGPVLGGSSSATVTEGGLVTLGATDTVFDGDDTLGTVTITGLAGDLSNFSGGSYVAGTGTWTGTAADFNALTFNAGETTGTTNLSISATTTGGEAGTTTGSYTLTVNPGAEGPVLGGSSSATVTEGGLVTLGATDTVFDGDDTLGTVTITGLAGDLSGFNAGSYVAGTGTWTGTAADFNALTFTAGETTGTTTLSISATTTGGEAGTTTGSYTLTVNPGAEGPVLGGSSSATVTEGGLVTLGATDTVFDGDDTLGTVTITGLAGDLSGFNAGNYVAGTGTWTGTAAEFNALTFNAGETTGTTTLSISATTTGGEAGTTTGSYTLTVNPGAEGPVLGGSSSATVTEGGLVTLGATDTVFDGDDTLGTVTITGLAGDLSGFNAGNYVAASGTWTGTAAEFNALTFTAGETTGTTNLSISATTTGGEAGTTTGSYTLTVNPGAEGPVLGGSTAATVTEGGLVTLGATDAVFDGDDTLGTVTITGLAGDLSNFNAGNYVAGTGTWTGTAAEFNALTFNAGETTGTTNLSISATTTGGEAGTTTGSYTLTVNPGAEGPVLGGSTAATVTEGGLVTLGATDAAFDGDDTLGTVTITGLAGDLSNFNAGNYVAGTGTWTGTAAEFNALTFNAGETTGTTNLSISATTTGGEAGTTTGSYTLTVNPGAEGPVLGGSSSATVTEGGLVTLGATDTVFDGDDTLGTVTITGLAGDLSNFSGGSYVAGTGTWTGTAAEFNALTFNAGETTGTTNLTISATTTGGEAGTTTGSYTLTVREPLLTLSAPAITGTAQEGQVLNVSTAAVSSEPTETTITYQWQSSTNNFSTFTTLGTGTSYLVKEGDEGAQIRVVATATDADGNLTVTTAASTPTGTVLDAAPTVTTPTITGTAQEGQTLTATAIASSADAVITYQWQVLNGATWANISGATGSTYLATEGNENHQLRVIASSSDSDGGKASATSAATAAVVDAAPTVTEPTITGTAQQGQVLTASASAGQSDNTVTYHWFSSANNYATAIGSGNTYVVKEGDEGSTIEVVATVTNGNGVTISATSVPTAAVVDAPPTVTKPTISGVAQEGRTLTASASAGQSDNTVTYQWFSSADGFTNAIGSGKTYVVKEGDEGSMIEAVATVTNGNGVTISATSAATAAVVDAAPTVTRPTISGVAQDGQLLTAAASSGQSDNAVTYQWFSSANNYTTAIGSGNTYVVQEGDEGYRIEVVATATNGNGVTSSATSSATATVREPAPTLTISSSALNLPKGGSVALGISAASFDSDDNLTVTIRGLASYEYITDGIDANTFSGRSVTLTAAEVSSGLTLHSTYTGSAKPVNNLTVTAASNALGETSTSAAKTITVTDPPPASTAGSPVPTAVFSLDAPSGYSDTVAGLALRNLAGDYTHMLMAQYAAAGFQSEFGGGAGGFITTPTPEAVHSQPPSLTKPT